VLLSRVSWLAVHLVWCRRTWLLCYVSSKLLNKRVDTDKYAALVSAALLRKWEGVLEGCCVLRGKCCMLQMSTRGFCCRALELWPF
jgi:hypothetical protein